MVKIIDWPSYDPTILELHSQGKSPNFISKQIGVQRETVVKRMESHHGIQTKRNGPRKYADWIDESTIRCSVCSEVKPKEDFYKVRKNQNDTGYYYSFCKSCNAEKEKTRYLSSEITWKKKAYDLKSSADRRGIEFNLTEDYLEYLFEIQNGLCAYTATKLDLSTGRGLAHDCVSVDRFNTSLGYVIGNSVICSARANTIKHNQNLEEFSIWMPSWYERGSEVLTQINAGWPTDDVSGAVIHSSQGEQSVLISV